MFHWRQALSLHRISAVAGCAVSAVLGMSLMASGQDQSVTIAKDAIFARKAPGNFFAKTLSTATPFPGRNRFWAGFCERGHD